MAKLKTINIKGKEYVEVNERLIHFRKNFPNYSLTTDIVEKTDQSITILASILNEEGRVIANGLAEEFKGSTFINKTSYVENCEIRIELSVFSNTSDVKENFGYVSLKKRSLSFTSTYSLPLMLIVFSFVLI